MKIKKWILVKHFHGEPKAEDLNLVEEDLSTDLEEDEILLEAVYLSVDPYMRSFSNQLKTPCVMLGEQLSRVIKSNNSNFPVDTLVLSNAGWRSHYLSFGKDLHKISFQIRDTPVSYCLGALGMPGAAAYFGLKLLNPKPGETLVVNAASGAVGSVVGQLAKIKGCTVIGFVGSDEKLKCCKEEFGYDFVFNYKKIKFSEALDEVAPDGVEMFFDNVGGEFYHLMILKHMKKHGRICICGSISEYNDPHPKHYPGLNWKIMEQELKVKGLMCYTYYNEWPQAFNEIHQYIKDGRLKVKETVYEGFDKMRDAFFGLFKGENIGKAIVKAH